MLALLAWAGLVAGAWLVGSPPVAGAEVDVSFDRAPVHEVLRVLAQAEGVNLIVDQGVVGEVTINARGMEAREAIELVAAVRGLHVEQVGNTLIVSATPTGISGRMAQPAASRLNFTQRPVREVVQALAERAGWNLISEVPLDQEITAWLEGIEPVEALRLVAGAAGLRYQLVDRVLHIKGSAPPSLERTAIRRLDHVAVAKAKELMEAFYPDVRVEVDPDTRSLAVRGPEGQMAEVEGFLDSLDTPRPQVLVEARILDVDVRALRSLGVEWFGESGEVGFSATWTPSPYVFEWDPVALEATLELLEEQGYSQVLASPKISAVDREVAHMLIGERRPVVTEFTDPDGRIFQEVEYHEVGIVLQIEPTIAADGSVLLEIHTEVSSVLDPEADIPTFRTREATSTVRVLDGRPLIIGGLIQEEERESLRGIPFLNQLPLVGGIFGRRTTDLVQKETIIVLVPHIVNPEAVAVAAVPGPAGPGAGAQAGPVGAGAVAGPGAGSQGSPHPGSQATSLPGSQGTPRPGSPAAAQPGSQIAETREIARSLGRQVFSRPGREREGLALAIDLSSLQRSSAEMQLEREQGNLSVISRLYASTGSSGGAWSLGAAFRYYLSGDWPSQSFTPWVEAGADYAWPLQAKPMFVYSAGAGVRLGLGEQGLLELYARHQEPGRKDGLAGLPGRREKQTIGVRMGWRY